MNPNGIQKLYSQLTPRERLPLIMAAALRKDEPERQRLVQTAPTRDWTVHDYYGTSLGHRTVAGMHVAQQLALLADYWHSQTRMAWCALKRKPEPGTVAPQATNLAGEPWPLVADVTAFRFCVHETAWRLFCERLNADPCVLRALAPNDWLLEHCTEAMPEIAPSVEEIRHDWPEHYPASKSLDTPDDVLKGYLWVFEDVEREWT